MALRVELAMSSVGFLMVHWSYVVDFVVGRLRQLDLLMMRMMVCDLVGYDVASDGDCHLGEFELRMFLCVATCVRMSLI